jgi:hypothetical protein
MIRFEETINHILVSCVFSRQMFSFVLQKLISSPLHHNPRWTVSQVGGARQGIRYPRNLEKGFNSLVILDAWEIWKHHNDCVFNGAQPNIPSLLQTISNKCAL